MVASEDRERGHDFISAFNVSNFLSMDRMSYKQEHGDTWK